MGNGTEGINSHNCAIGTHTNSHLSGHITAAE